MQKIERALMELDFIVETERQVQERTLSLKEKLLEQEEMLTNFSTLRENYFSDDEILDDFHEDDIKRYVRDNFDVYDWVKIHWEY